MTQNIMNTAPITPINQFICLLTYVGLGTLGLTLALPPGYASPIFPAAGFALAMCLYYGISSLPTVWVASTLMNIGLAYLNSDLGLNSVLVALSIGMGAAAQAGLGALLIRRFASKDWALFENESHAIGFLALGGLIACVVSASVGVGVLTLFDVVKYTDAPFLWWNWYVGDALGVLLLAPLAVGFFNRQVNNLKERLKVVLLPIVGAVTLAVLAFVSSSRWENREIDLHIKESTETLRTHIATRAGAHQEALSALARLVEVNPQLNQKDFEHFTQSTLVSNPDISALSFNPIVESSERVAFELEQRRVGSDPRFMIKEKGETGDVVSARTRPYYVPVGMIAPSYANSKALGFDINSEGLRRLAINKSIQTRSPAATAPIALVQDSDRNIGLLLLAPVFEYQPVNIGLAPEDRKIRGFAVAVIKMDVFGREALAARTPNGIAATLVDLTESGTEKLLYSSKAGSFNPFSAGSLSETLNFADRTWALRVEASPTYFAENRGFVAWVVGAVGLFFAALLQIMLLGISGRSALVQRTVDQQTREISDQKIALERSMAQTEKANSAKGQFLATMSHELRTPMNGILGMAQLLADENRPEEDKNKIQTILQSGKALLTILNDILDLSKIEAGKMELIMEPFSLSQMLREVQMLFQVPANEKSIDLSSHCMAGQDLMVVSDGIRIRQMLVNLVSNAIKFTDKGFIQINASVLKSDNGELTLRFEVVDSGVGIEPEKIEQLFNPFTQVDGSSTRRFSGTGLGLSITKRLARALGGDVGVKSVFGEGSTFWFTVKAREAFLHEIERSVDSQKRDDWENRLIDPSLGDIVNAGDILVAEDDPVNQIVVRKFLGKMNMAAQVVVDGEQALQAYVQSENKPKLILMDVQMPKMDGLQAARAIRAYEKQQGLSPCVMIALSASAFSEDIDSSLKAGMDQHLSKPINMAELEVEIRRVFKISNR